MTIDQNHPSAVVGDRSAWGYLAAGGILIAGVVAYLAVLIVMIDTQNVNFFPSLLFVAAITVPVSVLGFVYQAAPLARVPTWSIVFTAIVGGADWSARRRAARVRHPAPPWRAPDGARRRH
jgi:hypothetical protein